MRFLAAFTLVLSAGCLLATGKNQFTTNLAREQASGQKVKGPATITVRNVNVLRYQVSVGETVTLPSPI